MEEIKLYIPKGCTTLADSPTDPQIRLGLQGFPKCGKTFAALTFPNPIVANLDRGLGAHEGRSDIIEVPFWNGTFCDGIIPRSGNANPPNRKDALLKWIHFEGAKLVPEQTLIIDSLSAIEDAFHTEYRINPVVTKGGSEQGFAEWKHKQTYFGELMGEIKSLRCNVILCAHQSENSLKGGFRPLLSGGFADKLESHFTDWFNCIAVEKPVPDKVEDFKTKFGIKDKDTMPDWFQSTKSNTIYLWQTQSSQIADCGTTHLVNAPKFVLAGYNTFLKYGRKSVNPQMKVA